MKKAQGLKIAEVNPYLDVSGHDTAIKIQIICNVVMDLDVDIKYIYIDGIENISIDEIDKAERDNKKIKLIGKISSENKDSIIEVKPQSIDKDYPLYFVDGKIKEFIIKLIYW